MDDGHAEVTNAQAPGKAEDELSEAPAAALGALYQSTVAAVAEAAHNAVTAQQEANAAGSAAVLEGIHQLFETPPSRGPNPTKTKS